MKKVRKQYFGSTIKGKITIYDKLYAKMRRLFYFPRALKIRWIFAQRGPKWNGEWSTAEK